MLLTERYKKQIAGVISSYDRLIIQGTLPGWCFAGGMTAFLNRNKIRIFDYPQFANALREEIRSHAEAIARENDLRSSSSERSKPFARRSASKRF